MLNTEELKATFQPAPIIAGLTLEQLTSFFTDEEKQKCIDRIIKANHEPYSKESKALDTILRGTEDIGTKWEALVKYCLNPNNTKKGLRKVIANVISDAIKYTHSKSLRYFNRVKGLIFSISSDLPGNYEDAIKILKSIPISTDGYEPGISQQQLYEALSLVFEGQGNSTQAARSYELAHPTCNLYDSFSNTSYARRLTLFGKSLEDKQFLEEFRRAPYSSSGRHWALFRDTVCCATMIGGYPGAGIIFLAVQGHTMGVLAVGLLGLGVLIVGAIAGALIGCVVGAVQRVFEIDTREPQSSDERQKFLTDFFTRTEMMDDETKQLFINSIVEEYEDTKTIASSGDSEKTLAMLTDPFNILADKWLSLLFYINVANNNGKKLYQIVKNQFDVTFSDAQTPIEEPLRPKFCE